MQIVTVFCALLALTAVASAQSFANHASQPNGPSYMANPGPYTSQYNNNGPSNTPNNDLLLSQRNAGGVFGGAAIGSSPHASNPSVHQSQQSSSGPSPVNFGRSDSMQQVAGSQSAYDSSSPFLRFFGPIPKTARLVPLDTQLTDFSNSHAASSAQFGNQGSASSPQYNAPPQQAYGPSSFSVSGPSQSMSSYPASPSSRQSPSFTVGNTPQYAPNAASSNSDSNTAANNVLSLLHTSVPTTQVTDDYSNRQNSYQPQPDNSNVPQPATNYQNYGPSPNNNANYNTDSIVVPVQPNTANDQSNYSSRPSLSSASGSNASPTNYNSGSQRYNPNAFNGYAPTTDSSGATTYGGPGRYQPQQ